MNKIKKERLITFDLLKFFAIFLVLWGHCIQYFLSSQYYEEPIYRYIYAFHMPLFMMIAGYFSSSSLRNSFPELIKKKSIQLLLPCITWGILLWGMSTAAKIINNESSSASSTDIILSIYYTLKYNLWFLKSLFICFVLFFPLKFCTNVYYILVYLMISLVLSQYILEYSVYLMYPSFVCGYLLYEYRELIYANIYRLLIPTGILFLVMILFWDESFWTGNDHLLFRRVFRLILGNSGAVALILSFNLLFKNGSNSRFINKCSELGQFTLGIYIIQSILLEFIMARFIKMDRLDFITFNFVVAPLISIFMFYVCIQIIHLIRRSKHLKFVLLGERL